MKRFQKVHDEHQGAGRTLWLSIKALAMCACVVGVAGSVSASINMSSSPVWQSTWGAYPTGVGWADIDGHGWLDLVVAFGLDQLNQPCAVYFNSGGKLPHSPDWTSDHTQTHCQIYLGDLDNDGDPDLVVSSLGRTSAGFPLVPQLVYLNNGGISGSPDFFLADANSFSCGAGDPDADGDLDIAFAQGNAASSSYQKAAMYFNSGGAFDSTPDWETDDSYFGVDLAFCDIDLDGDLDLALGGKHMGIAVFYNYDGVLETSPSWQTSSIVGGRQIAFGDVDGDGYQDLAVAGINQSFFLFSNQSGVLENTPSWSSAVYEPSCVAWADADGDGDLDLAGGAWDGQVSIFENDEGTLCSSSVWSYTLTGWTQQIAWADYDEDFVSDTLEAFEGDESRKLFYLSKKPVHQISSIEVNGAPLDLSQYCYDLAEGWISLATPPSSGDTFTVRYEYSGDLDLVVSANSVHLFENLRYTAPPEDSISILLLMDNGLGANYDINDPTENILEQFQGFGWHITTAGLFDTISRCSYSSGIGLGPVTPDYQVSDIPDASRYDILCLLPGATGLPNIYDSQEALGFIGSAAESGVIVAAWCRAVRVLAAADLIDGLVVVGHADYQSEYEAAGAIYLGNNHPPIIQGNIVTSVRSNYYRTAMCQAMRSALPPSISGVTHLPADPTRMDSVVVTATATDHSAVELVELHVSTGKGFSAIAMLDDGNHHDGQPGDSVFGAVVPPTMDSMQVLYYVCVTDDAGTSVCDPPEAPAVAYSYTTTTGSCCVGRVGDVNCADDPEVPDVSDMQRLIDFMFINMDSLCCVEEADIDLSGQDHPPTIEDDVDISDMQLLIDRLFINMNPLPACP